MENTQTYESSRLRDNFLRKLSDYSVCIQPYLRNIQQKYVAAYYIVESEKVDLNQYCKNEYKAAIDARSKLEGGASEWFLSKNTYTNKIIIWTLLKTEQFRDSQRIQFHRWSL